MQKLLDNFPQLAADLDRDLRESAHPPPPSYRDRLKEDLESMLESLSSGVNQATSQQINLAESGSGSLVLPVTSQASSQTSYGQSLQSSSGGIPSLGHRPRGGSVPLPPMGPSCAGQAGDWPTLRSPDAASQASFNVQRDFLPSQQWDRSRWDFPPITTHPQQYSLGPPYPPPSGPNYAWYDQGRFHQPAVPGGMAGPPTTNRPLPTLMPWQGGNEQQQPNSRPNGKS